MFSQQDDHTKLNVIAYVSQSLHLLEQSMCNYSSAKLELLALTGVVTEIFFNYARLKVPCIHR